VEPTWYLRGTERTRDNNSSSSMKSPRLSETTTGRITALTSKAMETATTLEQPPVSTHDGGRCSEIKMATLPMREERLLLSQAYMIMRTTISSWNKERKKRMSISNGDLSTLMNTKLNQPRDNSIRSSTSTLKETSTLSHKWPLTDTLI
jgi:hypothetical protein